MNVLLTGAAGNVGYETLKRLIADKHNVTVLELKNRKNIKLLNKYKNVIEIVYGSINDSMLVERVVEGKDVVIHLAAVIPPLADKNPLLANQVNFYGTKNIVDAIKKSSNKPFLVYSSSVSVYGDRLENPYIKVGDKLKPSEGDYYATTKIACEELIKGEIIDYTIFRLTGIMGHPKTDPLMFHMPLYTKLEIASSKDTGLAFANSVDHIKELNRKTFNLGGGKHCQTTYYTFLTNMFESYGINLRYLNKGAFAEHNFHCGYFLDSYILNDILHFQNDTLETYYERIEKETNVIKKLFYKILSRPIMYFLLKKSDPLNAKKRKNIGLIRRFYKIIDKKRT